MVLISLLIFFSFILSPLILYFLKYKNINKNKFNKYDISIRFINNITYYRNKTSPKKRKQTHIVQRFRLF